MMRAVVPKLKWIVHPIFVFIVAQISWALLMVVWIRWYRSRSAEFEQLIGRLGVVSPNTDTGQWIILLEGCILMGILLVALYMVFVSFRRQVHLNRLQNSILSSVTHELKTPLASIRLYNETLMLHELSAEEQRKFIQKSLRELNRLQALVDRILLSAKLQTHGVSEQKVACNLSQIAMQSWRKSKERHGGKRRYLLIGLSEEEGEGIENETLEISGIPAELTMLFDNLLDNAVKYTKLQGLVQMEFRRLKDTAEFIISDDGIGIERENRKNVFKKFFRAEHATRLNAKGTGLGLSVAAAIAKKHQGSLSVMSKGPGKGASFHVHFKA